MKIYRLSDFDTYVKVSNLGIPGTFILINDLAVTSKVNVPRITGIAFYRARPFLNLEISVKKFYRGIFIVSLME